MKRILAIILMISCVMLSSCTLPSLGRNSQQDPNMAKLNEYRTGTDGVKIKFLDKLPPDQVGQNDILKAVFEVHNAGATDIEYGKIVLLTTDANVKVTPSVNEYRLRGKHMYFVEGEKTTEEFTVSVSGIGDKKTTLIGYTCYPYQTKAVDSICIDPTIGKVTVADKACEMKDMSFSGGQGAPVAVSNVKILPILQGNDFKLRLNITIENKGGGKVVSKNIASSECALTTKESEDVDSNVNVDVELSDSRPSCKSYLSGLNDPKSNKGYIICTTGSIKQKYASKASIVVTLDYGYVSKELTKSISIYQ
ncbi:hypothetical protein COV93_02525 [Candidatus Woesearchaeota archaeon CG11_big_fil_rev_8_21_14_0_20_43_8]|nr:MAG: hypothetical protein COV93_02525 [Candidatus Woesearchaeota archaeon CG11_big_fil_rev_8_21_14_0_20_43_8]PIO04959.1 MAG: hypothetical protein COT47_06810 [Candidatus Woesearchaeota archaeon CG08_land_8_20_14_0_20_43_7]